MSQALSSQRSWIARIAVLAMVASLMAFGAAPAGAAIDTSSSCPSSIPDAGFTDLAGVPAAAVDAINCVADYGISTGTTATTFDPFAAVQRWQMALFLTRQAAVHGVTLPSGADQGFTDLGGVPAAAVTAINQTAQLGISTGTSATTFDPFADVERWQMALFLTRLITGAGLTLPSGADQGFTDLAGVPAAAETAINQLAQLDISDGTTATTFDPFGVVERWAMALFLTRVLAADGITPAPPTGSLSGTIVVENDGGNTLDIEKSDGSVVTGVSYGETSDTYSIGGTPATLAAFEAATTVGDTIVATKSDTDADYDSFALTNVTVTSGLVGAVDIDGNVFSIVTVGNNVLATFGPLSSTETAYSVGGASATYAQFEAAVSHGDTVVVTPDGTDADTAIDAIALTNGSATGIAANVAKGADVTADAANDAVFTLGKLGDVYDNALVTGGDDTTFVATADTDFTQTYTVDGAPVVFASFSTALTNGDEVTYSRAGGTETFALVNKTVDTSFSGITVLDAIAGNTLTYLSGSTVSTFDISTATTITVDGTLVAVADVEAQTEGKGLPIADAVTYNGTTKALAFTNATSTPSVDIADVVVVNNGSVAGETFDLLTGGVLIFNNLPATFGSPNTRYFVNGTEVTQAVYEDYVIEIEADTNETGDSFQATLSGSFVEHRLTTTEVLP